LFYFPNIFYIEIEKEKSRMDQFMMMKGIAIVLLVDNSNEKVFIFKLFKN
jgi:hypothetical protein